jgi:hypothetical protein
MYIKQSSGIVLFLELGQCGWQHPCFVVGWNRDGEPGAWPGSFCGWLGLPDAGYQQQNLVSQAEENYRLDHGQKQGYDGCHV